MDFGQLIKIAVKASIEAGKVILSVYEKPEISTEYKEDKSPLTEADFKASSVINSFLTKTGYPIISEEILNQDYSERKTWKNYWIVDPLDGTKEFIKRNGEFTVNIAFCEGGIPLLGVIYVPVSRELYIGVVKNKEAYKLELGPDHLITTDLFDTNNQISPSKMDSRILRIVGSRSHMNQDTLDFIEENKNNYDSVEIVSKGSSLKFCLVAEGKANIYPRFAPTMEWDTAAGHAICNAVGLSVISQDTNQELGYNKENLLNPYFLVRK